MHCLASPRRQCVSIRLFLETDRRCPDCPSAPSDAPTIASSPVSATADHRRGPARPAAWILLHGDAVDIGCAPSGNDRVDFHSGRLKLNLVTNLLAYNRATLLGAQAGPVVPLPARASAARRRQADLLISATLRRPWSLRGATVACRRPENFIFLFGHFYIVSARCS